MRHQWSLELIIRYCALLFTVSLLLAQPAGAGIIDGMPDVIVCKLKKTTSRPGGQLVFYLEARFNDKSTYYKTLGRSAIQLKVDAGGKISARNIADCDGKTVKEVRDDGRAFDLR